jgi:hypothetical protein
MEKVNHHKLLANAFNKLHEQLSVVRSHVEAMDDPDAGEFMDSMELGLLAPMRRLRVHLGIPYDWHDPRPMTGESGQ